MKRITWVSVLTLLLLVLCSGVAFADDSQPYAAPTDLHWGSTEPRPGYTPGYIYWTDTVNTTCEWYLLVIYDESGKKIDSAWYKEDADETQYRKNDFLFCDVPSGKYRFSVQAGDYNNKAKNSEVVYSDFWTYTRPSEKLPTPKNVKLTGCILSWDNPDSYRVETQYGLIDQWGNEYGDGPFSRGSTSNKEDISNALQVPGSYHFRVRFVSGDMINICSSDWSDYVYFNYKGAVKKNYSMSTEDNGESLDIVVDEGHFSVTATGDLSEEQPLLLASYADSGRFQGLDVLMNENDTVGIASDTSDVAALWIGSAYQPKCEALEIKLAE